MSTNKKPRKAHRPRPIIQNPLAYMALIPEDFRAAMIVENQKCLQLMLDGHGGVPEWETIRRALNAAVALCVEVYAGQELDVIRLGANAHAQCAVRAKRTGRWLYSGEERAPVVDAIEVHTQQLNLTTVVEINRAIRRVDYMLRNGQINHIQQQARAQ